MVTQCDNPTSDYTVSLCFRFVYDSNGVEIGVCVNNGYYRHDFLGLLDDCDVVDPAYKVYLAVHKELRSSNTHLFDQIKTDKLFCISMVRQKI